MSRRTITKGRYQVKISPNGQGFYAVLTRDGRCLPGIPGRSYGSMERAIRGSNSLFRKAGA